MNRKKTLQKLFMVAVSTSLNVLSLSAVFADEGTSAMADNSKMNAGDQSADALTADQAKNTPADIELMRKIRRSVMRDKTLSVYAHNIKIIANHGQVTLKGAVHTEEEKTNVGMKANALAGAEHVSNEITVKGT